MRSIFFYSFLLGVLPFFSQTVSVSGTIQNEQNAKFIAKALVSVGDKMSLSDSNGVFKMTVSKNKREQLLVKLEGYKTLIQNFQADNDTQLVIFLKPNLIDLDEVTIQVEKDNTFGISRLNNVEGTTIYAGKKSEAVYVQDLNTNLASNNSRQIFSKIPGINVFENDGSGSTIGIGGRGLNPNRISNFNTRQNGYDISADALGYPESYYTPPTEAIERIEVLRGAAGLQFGTQFGGMINYKFTDAPTDKKFTGNFRQTAGSFGFFNSFNQIAGTVKKVSYHTFYQYKHYDGWRSRSELNSHNAFVALNYKVNEKLSIKGEYTFLNYVSQQPGGLTDKQFNLDNTLVNRQRNWFKVNWNLISLSANYKLTEAARISLVTFGLLAGRDALGVLGRTERPEVITSRRNLLNDVYNNYGAELKFLQRYKLFNQNNHFLAGVRYYRGQTLRKQGDADSTAAANFNFLNPDNLENSSYTFPSENVAVFTENIFQLTKKWNVTPGLRFEYIRTASEGYYRLQNTDLAGNVLPGAGKVYDNRTNERSFLLGGIGTQYKLNSRIEMYANISQNYRSINFNDMRVVNPNFQIDPNLKDENGYTVDGGLRGAIKNLLYFDVSVFMLQYNDRIGTALKVDSTTYQIVRYRTNIGNSRNLGVEAFAELDWIKLVSKKSRHKLSTFVNLSYINAYYISSQVAYDGKTVEFVPEIIFRTGITYAYKKFGITCQYSYTGDQFSDATNAVSAPSGIYGIIPAYSILDLSVNYKYKIVGINAGINNLLNSTYFTRRAEGYPGPGIIPADPINFYLGLQLKF